MLLPLISKWRKRTMIFEALIALDEFEKSGNRDLFKKWQRDWKRELDLIEATCIMRSK